MATQICFPTFAPLPGEPNPPTIDGFVEPEDFTDPNVDRGWTNAMRITYVADTAVGAGRPLTVIQCLMSGSAIYLSFVIRRDTQFNDNDCIVLVLRPSDPSLAAAKDGTERRIDIFPNSQGTGVAAGGNPRDVNYYRWNTAGAGSWQDMGTTPVTNVAIKCKSWDLGVNNKNWSVEVKLPTTVAAGGANWITLASTFGFYCNVIRLCDATECQSQPPPTIFDGAAFQFTFPRANYTTGDGLIQGTTDVNQAPIPLAWMAQAFLGSGPNCTGVHGVKFVNGANSIGVLSGGTIVDSIQKSSPNTFIARVKNDATSTAQAVTATFRIANWGIGPGDNAKWTLIPTSAPGPTPPANITGGGGTADLTLSWALTTAEQSQYAYPPTATSPLNLHQCIWVQLDSVQAVDFVESSMRRNMNFTALSDHEEPADVSGDGHPPPPGGGTDHDMLLLVSQQRRGRLVPSGDKLDVASRNQERLTTGLAFSRGDDFTAAISTLGNLFAWLRQAVSGYTVVYDWVWVTDAYRATERELHVGPKTFRVHEPVGGFGYIADHEGLVSGFAQSVTPAPADTARFQQTGPDSYRVRVPDGGKVTIITRLEARDFAVPVWVWLLLLLIIVLVLIVVF